MQNNFVHNLCFLRSSSGEWSSWLLKEVRCQAQDIEDRTDHSSKRKTHLSIAKKINDGDNARRSVKQRYRGLSRSPCSPMVSRVSPLSPSMLSGKEGKEQICVREAEILFFRLFQGCSQTQGKSLPISSLSSTAPSCDLPARMIATRGQPYALPTVLSDR